MDCVAKTLIIGKGEVGMSLYHVLRSDHETYIKDKEDLELDGVEVLNICFPYFEGFIQAVIDYQYKYNPALTIIHSTVPVGTSSKLGVVHSPIHGKHPNLSGGIKTFTKYIGTNDPAQADLAERFLRQSGIKTKIVKNPETSELSKIYCTTQYGLNIVVMKEIKDMCDKYGADFQEAYKDWNRLYNEGYEELGMPQFRRYFLDHVKGPIGGHCVINNAKVLQTPVAKFILEQNESY